MDWKAMYAQKRLPTLQDAAALIESGDKLVIQMIAGEPVGIMDAMADRRDELRDVEIYTMGPMNNFRYLDPEMEGHFRQNSFIFLCKKGRAAYRDRRAEYTPGHGSEVPRLLTNVILKDFPKKKNKIIMDVSPMDRNGFFSLGTTPGYCIEPALMENSTVIVEVNEKQPRIPGDNFIHVSDVDYVVENTHPIIILPSGEATPEDIAIANYIAPFVEDGATLQLGIGSMPNVLGELLDTKHDLGIHSEMMGDAFMKLWERGVATGRKKTLHPRKIVCCFALASQECYDWLENNPAVEFYSQAYTNDPRIIAQGHKPVAINQCIELDLFGQICSESMGINQYSGTGGQVDFTAGSQYNPEGKAFICLKSAAKVNGKLVSKIVPVLSEGATVSTLRTDVQYVVTEYGVAQLKGKSLSQRARELIAIAHPDFRGELTSEARRYKII